MSRYCYDCPRRRQPLRVDEPELYAIVQMYVLERRLVCCCTLHVAQAALASQLGWPGSNSTVVLARAAARRSGNRTCVGLELALRLVRVCPDAAHSSVVEAKIEEERHIGRAKDGGGGGSRGDADGCLASRRGCLGCAFLLSGRVCSCSLAVLD